MVVLEAFALLLIGLSVGILATMADVLTVGSASFLSHFALWVLVNTLVAVHVGNRLKACWWAIPFNLGFVEAYFITTSASFEGYAKSLAVPLAAVALISPLLTYAIWTARREKNLYGQVLSGMIVVGTLVASYAINGKLTTFDMVSCALIALVLLVLPVRMLSISRAPKPSNAPALPASDEPEEEYDYSRNAMAVPQTLEENDRRGMRPTRRKSASDERGARRLSAHQRRDRRTRNRLEAHERRLLASEEAEREQRMQRVVERREARERARIEREEQEYLEQQRIIREQLEREEQQRLDEERMRQELIEAERRKRDERVLRAIDFAEYDIVPRDEEPMDYLEIPEIVEGAEEPEPPATDEHGFGFFGKRISLRHRRNDQGE